MRSSVTCAIGLLLARLWSAAAWAPLVRVAPSAEASPRFPTHLSAACDTTVDRRTLVSNGLLALGATATSASLLLGSHSWPVFAVSDRGKVLVLGGTGLVGREVVRTLNELGYEVMATSTNGREGTVALDFTKDSEAALSSRIQELARGCMAVISCVGVIGTDDDDRINAGSGVAARAAASVGVPHFSYISVAPEVRDLATNIDFLQKYMKGKAFSESSIVSTFGKNEGSTSYTLIEPTFVYGGEKFGLNPPRVATFYGQFIESILSSSPLRAATAVAPEGIIKIALEPPVSATAVARAAVAGITNNARKSAFSVLDTHDKIIEAANSIDR